MRLTNLLGIAGLAAAAAAFVPLAARDATAQEKKGKVYYVGTQTKHTNVSFVSEADIETIYGSTHTASGQTWLDFKAGKGNASVTVPVKDLKTGIDKRDEHLRGKSWLDAEKHPDIVFKSGDIKVVDAKKGTWKAKGKLTIKGVTKDLTADVSIKKVPSKLSSKLGKGEWVRVKTSFDVKITDFGVKIPEGVGPKVSDTWTVKFQVYATTEK